MRTAREPRSSSSSTRFRMIAAARSAEIRKGFGASMPWFMGVSINPGETSVILTLYFASRRRSASEYIASPALVAEYDGAIGRGNCCAIDPIRTIRPAGPGCHQFARESGAEHGGQEVHLRQSPSPAQSSRWRNQAKKRPLCLHSGKSIDCRLGIETPDFREEAMSVANIQADGLNLSAPFARQRSPIRPSRSSLRPIRTTSIPFAEYASANAAPNPLEAPVINILRNASPRRATAVAI